MNTGNTTVDAIGKLNFSGNVIPDPWFKNVIFESGKADLIGINILAEIVYWYRPKEVRCEMSGDVLRYEKRFKADLLQRSYDSFADKFNITKRQAQESIKRLEDAGIIKRIFKTVKTAQTILNNVLFIELNVTKVAEITYTLPRLNVTPPTFECDTLPRLDVTPPTFECGTNTETTHKTTTESSTPPNGSSVSGGSEKKPQRKRSPLVTLKTFLDNCEANDETFIRDYEPVWEYAKDIGLPADMISLASEEFIRKFTEEEKGRLKKYKDWRLSFKNYVENGWLKLWFASPDGSYRLTTTGIQQARYFNFENLINGGHE